MADPATLAFERLIGALNHPGDPARLAAAVTDEVRLDRHGPGARGVAPVVEVFSGIAEVERWFARTPAEVRFSLAGAVRPDGEGWSIEYAYDAADFHHGGIWFARLAEDGRISYLSHHPFALSGGPAGSTHPAHG